MNIKKILLGMAGVVALATAATSASAYTISAKEYLTGGAINAGAFTCTTATNVACASFSYSGPLNFSNTAAQNSTNAGDLNSAFFIGADISGYSGSGTVVYGGPNATAANFTNVTTFLASSGSIAGLYYGTAYSIDLGTLAAGTVLTITHDDGVAVSGATGSLTAGPTVSVTESAYVGTTGDVKLYYTRQNGTPSILQVAVPEPATLSIFGGALLGLVGMAGLKRRNRKSA